MTRNEILTCLNKREDFILAGRGWKEIKHAFHVCPGLQREPDFAMESVDYNPGVLLARAEPPGVEVCCES